MQKLTNPFQLLWGTQTRTPKEGTQNLEWKPTNNFWGYFRRDLGDLKHKWQDLCNVVRQKLEEHQKAIWSWFVSSAKVYSHGNTWFFSQSIHDKN